MLNILSTVTTAVTHLTRFLRAPSMWQDTYTKRFKEAHLRIVSTTLASVERVMGIYIGMEWGSRSPALGGSTTPMTSDPNGWAMFGIISSALPHMNSVLATPREGVCCSHVTLCVCVYRVITVSLCINPCIFYCLLYHLHSQHLLSRQWLRG